jgi:hypothetical protein
VKRGEKGVGGADSVTRQVGEVLGDVAVPPELIVREKSAKFVRRRERSSSNANDDMKGMKEGMDASDVGGALMRHAKEHNKGVRRGS